MSAGRDEEWLADQVNRAFMEAEEGLTREERDRLRKAFQRSVEGGADAATIRAGRDELRARRGLEAGEPANWREERAEAHRSARMLGVALLATALVLVLLVIAGIVVALQTHLSAASAAPAEVVRTMEGGSVRPT